MSNAGRAGLRARLSLLACFFLTVRSFLFAYAILSASIFRSPKPLRWPSSIPRGILEFKALKIIAMLENLATDYGFENVR